MTKIKKIKGIVLFLDEHNWVVCRNYKLYRFDPLGNRMQYFSRLDDKKNGLLTRFFLTRRLFRAEITHLYHFEGDNWMCIAKSALFRYNKKSGLFEKCHEIEKGSRPMNLCQGNDGTIYYGEYCSNALRHPMRIFQSKDQGDSWTVAYTFGENEINHIHGIFNDPFTGRLWVATGDDDVACIFGYTEDGFKTLIRQYEGTQQYRICVPLFTKDEIIFATDSQYEQNYIRSINRQTGEVKDLQAIQGSGIYAVQNGKLMLVSTTVEPSAVNKDQSSHLWYSWDGRNWKELISFKKDCLPKTYFQFGSIRFPHYESACNWVVFHGRALKKLDGKTMIIPITELEK